jgi:hypothetical protein
MRYLIVLLASAIMLGARTSLAQTLAWTAFTNGSFSGSIDTPVSANLNADGSVYVAGAIEDATSYYDWCLKKYNSSGTQLWQQTAHGTMTGFAEDRITGMTVDSTTADAYVCGFVINTSTNGDWRICRYSAAGSLVWTREIAGTETVNPVADLPKSIQRDANGDVYVTGYLINSNAGADWCTIKLNGTTGAIIWSQTEHGTGTGSGNIDDEPVSMKVGTDGVYVTGYETNNNRSADWLTVKYNLTTGARIWSNVQSDGQPLDYEAPTTMTLTSDALIVSGYTFNSTFGDEFMTIKYNLAGTQLWTKVFNRGVYATGDSPSTVFADSSSNIYVGGTTADFAGGDWTLLKYDTNGNLLWTYFVNGTSNTLDPFSGAQIAPDGNLVLYGATADTGYTGVWRIIEINPSGTTLWNQTLTGAQGFQDNRVSSVKFDSSGNIYAVGYVTNFTYHDWATRKYSSSGSPIWTVQSNGVISNSDDKPKGILFTGTAATFYLWGMDNTFTGMDWALRKYTQP